MMPSVTVVPPAENLKDLARLVQSVEGFPALAAALRGGRAAAVDGAWGSSGGLMAAALAQLVPRTLLVVVPFPRDADGWAEDIANFAEVTPALFPAWDDLPTEHAIADEIAGQRLRMLRQLSADQMRVVVTTIQALMQPVPDRSSTREQPALAPRRRAGGTR